MFDAGCEWGHCAETGDYYSSHGISEVGGRLGLSLFVLLYLWVVALMVRRREVEGFGLLSTAERA